MAKRATSGSFKKGNKGKPKGAKSKKTLAWEQLGDFLTEAGAAKAKDIMLSSSKEDFMRHYTNLLEFFKPKQSRSDVNQNNTGEQVIIIKRGGTGNYAPRIQSTSGTASDSK
jgi:hypothetical protein